MLPYFRFYLFLALYLLGIGAAYATPSTEFWTPCTTDVQPCGTYHIGVDNYFTVFNKRGHGSFFYPDVGLTVGVFSCRKVSSELGIDYLGGADHPIILNGKVGVGEDYFFKNAPSFSFGIFNLGMHRDNNWDILYLVAGKILPECFGGRFFVSYYHGNRSLGRDRQGFMVAYDREFVAAKDSNGKEYKKWLLVADYASGRNALGGGGVGVAYRFTSDISLLTGPVFFNDAHINGRWKWSVQVDINI